MCVCSTLYYSPYYSTVNNSVAVSLHMYDLQTIYIF